MIQKEHIPHPYEKAKQRTPDLDNSETNPISTVQPNPTARYELPYQSKLTYFDYQAKSEALSLPKNPDFTKANDGAITCSYFEISGRPYRISKSGKKEDCIRRIGEHTKLNVVYIPPAIRDKEAKFEGQTLFLVQDEIQAWILTEFKIPAVGLPRPNSFLTRPSQSIPHKLIKQVLRQHELDRIAYLAPSIFTALPPPQDKVNPYEHINASKYGEEAVHCCAMLEKAFEQTPCHMYLHPDQNLPGDLIQEENWLDTWSKIPISSGTNHLWKETFHIDSPEKFYAWHGGPTVLGYTFQMGKHVYEYDPATSIIELAGNSKDVFSIKERLGRYWALDPHGGERPISNFTMKFMLEVKQENSFFLIQFNPIKGKDQTSTINVQDLTKPDQFKCRVIDIPHAKFDFWGGKAQLEQIVAMSRSAVPEAISLENHLGFHAKSGLFVYGNGVLDPKGLFIDADENGVSQVQQTKYFLPGYATFNDDRKAEYRDERQFQYLTSGVELHEWTSLFIKVHGNPGHMALCFLFASLYLDLFREEGFQVFPHFSLFAPPESGKTSIVNSLSRFFGDLTQSNLRAGVTHASFDRKIEKYHDALIILNEFNLSNPKVQRMSLEEYLVGVYDDQAREKTVNNKSKQAKPNSSIITVGQESFWHREALASRCVIQQLEGKTERTNQETRLFNELEEMVQEGISEFNSIFFSHRSLIKEHLRETVKATQQALKSFQKGKVSARLVLNWALVISPILILIDEKVIQYPLSRREILGYAAEQIAAQARRMISEGVLSIFFAFVAAEYGPKKLLSHQDVWLYRKENKIRIRLGTVHKGFRTYILKEGYGIENTSKEDLEGRLKAHPSFIRIGSGIQVGYRTRDGGFIATNSKGKPIPNTPGCKIVELDMDKIHDFSLPDVLWNEEEEETQEKIPF